MVLSNILCEIIFLPIFFRKGRLLGTFPMGFALQVISIFRQTNARSI